MPAGRPRKYKTAEELEAALQKYFDSITKTELLFDTVFDYRDEEGKDHFKQVPILNDAGEQLTRKVYFQNPSILGMCLFLDVTSETLCQWEQFEEEYADTIKKAKAKVESYLEGLLERKEQVAGVIFNLKNNFGWKDKTEIDQNIKTDLTVNVLQLSDADLDRRLRELSAGGIE